MISTVTVEAHFSTNYVENYLDSVENLPDDVQRHLSRIREIDVLYRSHLRDVNLYYEQWVLNQPQNGTASAAAAAASVGPVGESAITSSTTTLPGTVTQTSAEQSVKRAMTRIQKSLIAAQELGDEKLQIVQQLHDLIDHKTRQLDQDFVNLGSEFFARCEFSRDDKTLEVAKEGNSMRTETAVAANNGPGHGYGVAGNGPGVGPGGGTGPHGGNSGSSGPSTGGSNSSHLTATGNGTVGGAAGGNHHGAGATTSGSGMFGGNGGNNHSAVSTLANERSSKRARRTRNEQTNSSSANGSNTPNSVCGVSAMEIDPIDVGGASVVPSGGTGIGGSGVGSGGNGTTVTNPLTGGNGGTNVSGGIKMDTANVGVSGGSGGGNGGNAGSVGGAGGSGSGHSSLSGAGSSQGPGSAVGGGGSKTTTGGNGNNNTSSSGSGSGNNGGTLASSSGTGNNSNVQSASANQSGSKKSTNTNNTGSASSAGGANSGKKKKRKTGGRGAQANREAREDTPAAEETIDPDEPTYCLCDQISFGEMILCDNDLCPIEWFHFSCVSLISKPKGRWFCPNCRGDRPNVMKPKAQFLKELERYNKEKEEKT